MPAPSFAAIMPEAIVVDEGEDKTSQQESATSGVKLELVDDPLLADVEVKKMKEFSHLFKYANISFSVPFGLCCSIL